MKKLVTILISILFTVACASDPVIYSDVEQVKDLTDLDYDGVIAARDDCENTVTGASTNNFGCPEIIQRPKITHLVIDFKFDKYTLDAVEISHVEELASFMQKNSQVKVILIGDTSIEGTDDYNKALSLKRIVTVYNLLIKMGVNPGRIVTETFDSENHIPSDLTGRDSRLIAVAMWPEQQNFKMDWTIYDKAKTNAQMQ
jgi:outer membrane protein OmpA-like peptidoglycan-associated protein